MTEFNFLQREQLYDLCQILNLRLTGLSLGLHYMTAFSSA